MLVCVFVALVSLSDAGQAHPGREYTSFLKLRLFRRSVIMFAVFQYLHSGVKFFDGIR